MKFLLYNIRYGTGGNMNRFPLSGYMGKTHDHLEAIIRFLKQESADVIGLIEVDAGSYRSDRKNQAELIAESLGHYHTYKSKYPVQNKLLNGLPVLSKQGNAFISKDTIKQEKFHYVTRGMKRLVIELELENIVILLVHLALSYKARHEQLTEIKRLVRSVNKPCLVAGDFNAFKGHDELELFREAAGLHNAGPANSLTYPSWKPKLSLDFVLHTPDIVINDFRIPQVDYSDHLPLIVDFEIVNVSNHKQTQAAKA
ncbi:MAG: endonuclease/exonuclease/phosphatase family protein [Leucothrix sp.]